MCLAMAICAMAKPVTKRLTTENMQNPLGISVHAPRFSWQIDETKKNTVQTAYHILVASKPELLKPGKADLWDSGVVSSDQSLWVQYAGKALKDQQQAYWTVQVNTNNGQTEWSEVQMFSIGLTVESHWKGRWIGHDGLFDGEHQGYRSRLAARYLRQEAMLKDQPIKRATAYVAVVGLYEFYVNGQRVGDQVLAPQPTDTRKSIIYNTFDITQMLQSGKKAAFGITLGTGRAFPMRQSKPSKWPFMGWPKCRVNIVMEYADGTTQTVVTDESWRLTANGPIRANNEYDGEEYDARMELGDWTKVGYDDSSWLKAERTDVPMAELIGQPAPNMECGMKRIKPISITKRGNNFIVDFGQNMAGWVEMRMNAAKGDTIKIKFAEKLQADGSLYLANIRDAITEDAYVSDGTIRLWHPTFVTHGFRYAEVKGAKNLNIDDLEAQTVSDKMDVSGEITTSNDVLNRVYKNAWWGILSNYKGMPVDCPQRNERQPWLGDRTVGSLGESFIFNNERLYSKWMRDICESQRTDGVFSDVAPAFWNYYNDDVTWPSALPFTCEMLYRQYGNKQPAIDAYPYLQKWINHVLTEYMHDYIITKDQYGDWCMPPESLELIHSKDPARITDGSLISTAYMIKVMRQMQLFAGFQNLDADKKKYAEIEKNLTEAFNKKFLHIKRGTSVEYGHYLYPDSVFYGNNSSTSNLLPLALDIVPEDCYQDVRNNLITDIITNKESHISCGVIGISWLMRTLSKIGRADVAYLLASQKTYPSWGYMAEHGATTIWELWNGDTANPAMNSGNHVMLLGDLITWYYENLAGIKNAEGSVAYKHIRLAPNFEIQELDNVSASYETPYGKVVSSWNKTLENLTWNVEIPVNTTADICLPDGTVKTVGSGAWTFTSSFAQQSAEAAGVKATIVDDEFVYDQSQYPETHASSIVELKNGDLVATYFGGTKERNPDVCIWTQIKKKGQNKWSEPVLAADGVFLLGSEDAKKAGITTDGQKAEQGPVKNMGITWAMAKNEDHSKELQQYRRKACWNPVLYQMPDGEIWLFFKIGSTVGDWTGWLTKSKDGGRTWSDKEALPENFLGPVKNKPELFGDRLICPTSTENNGWRIHFEIYNLKTKEWKYVGPINGKMVVRTIDMLPDGSLNTVDTTKHATLHPVDCIQPSIIKLADGRLQVLCRSRNGKIATSFSSDLGDSWSDVELLDLENNQSGTDAVTLRDGRHVIIYNNTSSHPGTPKGVRTPVSLAISNDGTNWTHLITLEDSPISQYSYPSIIQGKDGSLHCIYTWRRQRIVYKRVILK